MPKDYDFYEGVLKKYITATEDGEPVISENDLEQALTESEIPKSDAEELSKSLDVENGYISVENYLLAVIEYAESKADERNPESGPGSESVPDDSAEDGGFVNDEDDNEEESDEYVDDEDDNDDDEDYNNSHSEIRDKNTKDTIEQVFKLISNSKNQLTVDSLKKAFERINFPVDEHDLKSMLEIASTKPQFSKLWDELYN